MGNSHSGSHNETDTVLKQYTELLMRTFQNVCGNADHGDSLQGEDAFSAYFNPLPHEFCALLHDHFCAEGTTSLNEDHFIKTGLEVINLSTQQDKQKFYFSVFSRRKIHMVKPEFELMSQTCFAVATGDSEVKSGECDTIVRAMTNFLTKDSQADVTLETFLPWCASSCPRMFDPLHHYLLLCLKSESKPKILNAESQLLHTESTLLSPSLVWSLSCLLHDIYYPVVSDEHNDTPPSQVDMPSENFSRQMDVVRSGTWYPLYDSNEHGVSINRFIHHVFAYRGPTISLFQFGDFLYCVGVDSEWQDSADQWGGFYSGLIEVYPEYNVVEAGSGLLFLNTKSKRVPKGIQFGTNPKSLVLQIDEDLHKMKHYGKECTLGRIEVWGCGDRSVRAAQLGQKKWEAREAEKLKHQKLKMDPEDWQDSPDRLLMEMGGVKTKHAEK